MIAAPDPPWNAPFGIAWVPDLDKGIAEGSTKPEAGPIAPPLAA